MQLFPVDFLQFQQEQEKDYASCITEYTQFTRKQPGKENSNKIEQRGPGKFQKVEY